MSKQGTVTVLTSPHSEDVPPWSWEDKYFCMWVHEVFLEGYKRDVPLPSLDEAMQIVTDAGYTVKREDSMSSLSEEELIEEQGWNDQTMFTLAREFISNAHMDDAWDAFLQEQADTENDETGDEEEEDEE